MNDLEELQDWAKSAPRDHEDVSAVTINLDEKHILIEMRRPHNGADLGVGVKRHLVELDSDWRSGVELMLVEGRNKLQEYALKRDELASMGR